MIYENIAKTVGNTPLVRLNTLFKGKASEVVVKLEFYNPSASLKDRIAVAIIDQAISQGILAKGDTVIEATSGNTGIALAMVGAAYGLKVKLVMPESMSLERRALLRAYGAELVLTPAGEGIAGSVKVAEELAAKFKHFQPKQFENPINPQTHYENTGPEIWRDTEGKVSALFAGLGTGGTLSGAGRYLKEQDANIGIFGVEPLGSPLLNGGKAGPHLIQGIGANFIPKNVDTELIDKVYDVSNEEALEFSRKIARCEGILVGISSGAVLAAVDNFLTGCDYPGQRIVAVLASYGERYLSTTLYKEFLN